MREVPVYLFTGFLESGKTSFISDTLMQKQFNAGEKTVLLAFEDGFTEYDEKTLSRDWNTIILHLDDEEELTPEYLQWVDDTYQPERVMVEFNGMWNVSRFVKMNYPTSWQLVQVLNTINTKTFNQYINNMRSLVYEQALYADLVIFNRYSKEVKKSFLRNNIKAINPKPQILYELENGFLDEEDKDDLPYDINQEELTILDHDYGIFCMDILDRPHLYDGKIVTIKGRMMGLDKQLRDGFILGRQAMVCCEDDTSLVGLIGISHLASQVIPGEWIQVTGEIGLMFDEDMLQDIALLHVDKLDVVEGLEDEYVYF